MDIEKLKEEAGRINDPRRGNGNLRYKSMLSCILMFRQQVMGGFRPAPLGEASKKGQGNPKISHRLKRCFLTFFAADCQTQKEVDSNCGY